LSYQGKRDKAKGKKRAFSFLFPLGLNMLHWRRARSRRATANMRNYCWLALVVFMSFGCGGTGRTYTVSGMVALDDEPIAEGHILFIPEDRTLSTEGGPIRNGQYSFQARAGKKRVEITATRPDPNAATSMGPTYVDYVPEAYNRNSKLSVEVTPDGKNQFDFPLKSRVP
jgi:hypothetical protein